MVDRNIGEVIDELLRHIPAEEVDLVSVLEKIKHDASYAAPEDHKRFWFLAAKALSKTVNRIAQRLSDEGISDEYILTHMPEWCGVAQKIFTGQTLKEESPQ